MARRLGNGQDGRLAGRQYSDLRDHLKKLEEKGLLYRIKREINKDTELHPLVRWQYRGGIPEGERKAFLFENVVDARTKYGIPVVVGGYAASAYIYALGLGCEPEEMTAKWDYALSHPIEPVAVPSRSAPVHEVIRQGKELKEKGGGLDEFPIPISTPGFDCAPYTTCSNFVTKDPDTGVQNIGNYRGQVKARNRIGVDANSAQDFVFHWRKWKERGVPMEAAAVIGPPPVVAATSAQKVPRGVDECAVSGGIAGEPIRVVKCKTVDLLVPAESEIVFEGLISTEYMEPEAPFGESHGYMSPREPGYIFDITAITCRKDCIWTSWISQVTPSESSVIKRDAYNALFYRYLKTERRIPSVSRVVMHEALTNLRKVIFIQMKQPSQEDVWRALYAAVSNDPGVGKIIIAVDEDIDPENLDAVFWAMAYRMKPHEDVVVLPHRGKGHGPPFYSHHPNEELPPEDSALLMNATLKEPFPPVALPKREYMERAKEIWEELGLPKLKPENPWFGYSLGQWDDEVEEDAQRALRGEHYVTGEKLATRRIKV